MLSQSTFHKITYCEPVAHHFIVLAPYLALPMKLKRYKVSISTTYILYIYVYTTLIFLNMFCYFFFLFVLNRMFESTLLFTSKTSIFVHPLESCVSLFFLFLVYTHMTCTLYIIVSVIFSSVYIMT